MTEEGQVQDQITSTTTTTTTPPMIIDEDGNFVENWTQQLKDESLHDDPTLKTIKSIDLLASNHVIQRKKIGGNTILTPNEASNEAEWDAYYVAGGRPDTAADYNLSRPEELPEEYYNKEFASAAQDLFHKIGLSQKQADALFAFNNDNVITQLAKNAQDNELTAKELKDGLYADWGNAYEQRKHLGNAAIEQGVNGDADFKERLTQKFGNDPDFIRFAANVGSKFVEHSAVDPSKLIPTTGDLQTRIDEEMHKHAYGLKFAEHGFSKVEHKRQVDLVYKLRQELMKSTKTG